MYTVDFGRRVQLAAALPARRRRLGAAAPRRLTIRRSAAVEYEHMFVSRPGHPAPRHGRLLRLGRAGATSRTARPTGDRRRRARRPRRGLGLLLRGARLRRAQRYAHRPGRASLPAGRVPAGRMDAYIGRAPRLLGLLGQYTDLVEVASIDEAYLDVTGSRRLFGPPRAIAHRIQEQVYDAHGITCSVGIGPTKLLAKLAAGLNKPAGIGELTAADVTAVCAICRCATCAASARSPRSGSPPSASPRSACCRTCRSRCSPRLSGAAPRRCASSPSGAVSRRCAASGRCPSRSAARSPSTTTPTTSAAARHAALAHRQRRRELRRKGLAARTVAVKVRVNAFHTVEPALHAGAADQRHAARLRTAVACSTSSTSAAAACGWWGSALSDLTHGASSSPSTTAGARRRSTRPSTACAPGTAKASAWPAARRASTCDATCRGPAGAPPRAGAARTRAASAAQIARDARRGSFRRRVNRGPALDFILPNGRDRRLARPRGRRRHDTRGDPG